MDSTMITVLVPVRPKVNMMSTTLSDPPPASFTPSTSAFLLSDLERLRSLNRVVFDLSDEEFKEAGRLREIGRAHV